MPSLSDHRAYLEDEWRAAQAAPLSLRKAMLVAMLVDAYMDRLFAEGADPGDILEFRSEAARRAPALGAIMGLAAQREGFGLVTEAVAVPIADYGALPVEDFMVSLYNDHSVQRLRLILPGGDRRDMLDVLDEALAGLDHIAQHLNNPTS